MSTITLLRHAKVDMKKYGNISARGFGLWIHEYNTASIKKEVSNKDNIFKILDDADIILCSKLNRSIESVGLFNKSVTYINELFNEVELSFFSWDLIRLRPRVWLIFFRILWFLGYSKNVESYYMAKKRAKLAAKMLIDLSDNSKSIALMGHGVMNRLIIKELLSCNYIKVKNTGTKNWSYRILKS